MASMRGPPPATPENDLVSTFGKICAPENGQQHSFHICFVSTLESLRSGKMDNKTIFIFVLSVPQKAGPIPDEFWLRGTFTPSEGVGALAALPLVEVPQDLKIR